MPTKPAKPCRVRTCANLTASPSGYCDLHAHLYKPFTRSTDTRTSSSARGYGAKWRSIRAKVLKNAGIPKEQWPLYDVDHNPPYNPAVEPNHLMYTLIPRLHSEHSRKTAKEDGGFGRKASGEGGIESLGPSKIDRSGESQKSGRQFSEGGL